MAWKESVEKQLRTIEQEMKDTARCISILLSKNKEDVETKAKLDSVKERESMLVTARDTLSRFLAST